MITVSELKSRVDVLRRDSTSGTVDNPTIKEAINATLDELRGDIDITTAVERTSFYYLAGVHDYDISNTLSISDFSNVKDIRQASNPHTNFTHMTSNDFERRKDFERGYAVETIGDSEILKISPQESVGKKDIHNFSDIDNNGTWSADTNNSDAHNLAQDSVEYVEGSASLKFDIDVSQSGSDYAEISVDDMSSIDLSGDAYDERARFRIHVFIPSGATTDLNSFTLRWGSDDSNYWEVTSTTTANAGSFDEEEWNEIEFAWPDSTVTGSPDSSDIKHLTLRVNYDASYNDQTGFRVDDLDAYEPFRLELVYYSNYWVDDGSGNSQEYVTDVTGAEKIRMPGDFLQSLAVGTTATVFHYMGGSNADDATNMMNRWENEKFRIKEMIGVKKNRKGDLRAHIPNPWPSDRK